MIRNAIMLLTQLLPDIYTYVYAMNHRYNILTGGKNAGKTYGTVMMILLKFLFRKNIDVLVLRKFNKDHLSSTYRQYVKTIRILDTLLKPFGFKLEKNFKFVKQPTPEITYIPTGQRIMFAGMDDPGRVAGMTTDNPNIYIGIIHVEEPIEVSDLKGVSQEQQRTMAINFATIENSAFRADVSIKNPIFQVYMTMNMWEFLSSWIYNDFPYQQNMDWEGNREHLEGRGWIKYEDPNYMGGRGLLLLHTTYRVLENAGLLNEEQEAIHNSWKLYDPEKYDLISLGIPTLSDSLGMIKYKDTILREAPDDYEENNEVVIPTDAGIDIGQLQDDTAFVVFMNKYRNGKIERDYFHTSKKYSFSVPKEPSLKKQARMMIEKSLDILEDYPIVSESKFNLLVHRQADFKLFEPFNDMKIQIEKERNVSLNWLNIVWAPNPARADNKIGARVGKWKESLDFEKWIIEQDDLYNDIIYMEFDRNLKRVEDRRKLDITNAAEQYINTYYYTHKSEWDKQRMESRASRTKLEKMKKKKKNNI